MSGLPRIARQYVIGLRAKVKASNLTADEAGAKLASYLKDKYPALADSIITNWCIARFRLSNPLPEGWMQQELWPAQLWHQPLSEAIAYVEVQAGITSRFQARNELRRADLADLRQAAGGDLTMTLEDAYRLAHPEEATG